MQYPDGFLPEHRNRGICGVLALSICADVSFDVARATLKMAMHKLYPTRQRFRVGTHKPQIELALKMLGIRFVNRPEYEGMTVGNFTHICKPDVKYMVYMSRHVATVFDRKICDQGAINLPVFHRVSRWKINRPVIEIIGRGWGEQT